MKRFSLLRSFIRDRIFSPPRFVLVALLSFSAVFFVVGPVCGAVEVCTEQISTATQLSSYFQLPQFNPALGTLTSVTLSADFTSITPDCFCPIAETPLSLGLVLRGR